MDYESSILFIGVGATLATDLWAIARGRLLGVPAPDWGLVGRWLGHMARGRFRHERIAAAEPLRGERVIGWTAHYLIGIAFAECCSRSVGSRGRVSRRLPGTGRSASPRSRRRSW